MSWGQRFPTECILVFNRDKCQCKWPSLWFPGEAKWETFNPNNTGRPSSSTTGTENFWLLAFSEPFRPLIPIRSRGCSVFLDYPFRSKLATQQEKISTSLRNMHWAVLPPTRRPSHSRRFLSQINGLQSSVECVFLSNHADIGIVKCGGWRPNHANPSTVPKRFFQP